MRRIRLTLQYDGAGYNGWQIQPSGRTIQGLLQDSICRLTGENATVIAAGRTDAGVHAIEQVAAFDTGSSFSAGVIKRALNAMLPQDIRITDSQEATASFHPRYDALSKRYVYMIANMEDAPLFFKKYLLHIKYPLNTEAMNEAAGHLIGTHDFSSFRGAGCGARNPVRSLYSIEIEKTGEAAFLHSKFSGNYIKISVTADAFLRHMVRNIVGTLVDVGRKKIPPDDLKKILDSKDRRTGGPTAPANGLFLDKVFYP